MEVMSLNEQPWEDLHHHSSFLPDTERVEDKLRNFEDHVNTAESTPDLPNPLYEGILETYPK